MQICLVYIQSTDIFMHACTSCVRIRTFAAIPMHLISNEIREPLIMVYRGESKRNRLKSTQFLLSKFPALLIFNLVESCIKAHSQPLQCQFIKLMLVILAYIIAHKNQRFKLNYFIEVFSFIIKFLFIKQKTNLFKLGMTIKVNDASLFFSLIYFLSFT